MRKWLLILILLPALAISQTTYYLSNTGSDGAAGTSSGTAWQTLTKLETEIGLSTIVAGDNIVFNRDDIFDGTLTFTGFDGTSGNPITFGAYGTGADPILRSIDTITDSWSLYRDNIYQVTLSQAPASIMFLFVDGVKTETSRLPNTGYYKADTSVNTTSFVDSSRTEADDYFNGATAVMHTAEWALEKSIVTDYTLSTFLITYSPATNYSVGGFQDPKNSGYMFRNDTVCIDLAGEWAYDATIDRLYYNGDPSGLTFIFSTVDNIITATNSDYLTFENIRFEKAEGSGINLNNCDYVIVDACEFQNLEESVFSILSDYDTVKNCNIEDISVDGIVFARNYYGAIINNTFTNIGVVIGEGGDFAGEHLRGISIEAVFQNDRWEGCDSVLVKGNTIDTCSYSGIHVEISNDTRVFGNRITEHSQTKADGGGIYLWHNADSAHIPGGTNYVVDYDSTWVQNNYSYVTIWDIDNSWLTTKTGSDTIYPAYGIYIDDGNMNYKLENNVMIGGAFNLFLHNSGHALINNNITYKSRAYEYFARNNLDANKDTVDHATFSNNQWIQFYDGTEEIYKYPMFLLYVYETYDVFYTDNYYMFPFSQWFVTSYVVDGFDGVASMPQNIATWNTWTGTTGEDIQPFNYTDTELTDRDSLVHIVYNFSNAPINANSTFLSGYNYFDADSTEVTTESVEAYGSRVYLVHRGADVPGGLIKKMKIYYNVFNNKFYWVEPESGKPRYINKP